MEEITINLFTDFMIQIDKYDEFALFRGVSKSSYELIPKVARQGDNIRDLNTLPNFERDLLKGFEEMGRPHLNNDINSDELQIIAQHYGLPTRLLDWTTNPLVALFFAIEKNSKDDGAIYVLKPEKKVSNGNAYRDAPQGILYQYPPHIDQRIIAQASIFTYHKDEAIPLKADNIIDKLVIPENIKKDFRLKLKRLSITKMSLFPGLDGIAEYLRWLKGYE